MENQLQISRSGVVTVIAWIFIILSGITILISLTQYLLFTFMPQAPHMQHAMQVYAKDMPLFTRFMAQHPRLEYALLLLVSSLVLVISIALLKRKSWSRKAMIAYLSFMLVWEFVNLVFKVKFLTHMPPPSGAVPAQLRSVQEAMFVFYSIWAVGLSIFFAWVITRLLSKKIKAEFTG